MDVNAKIIKVCNELGIECEQDLYEGKEEKFVTYNYVSEETFEVVDDEVTHDRGVLYIHLFTPKDYNYMSIKHSLRDKLEKEGFVVQGIQSYLEQGTKIRHTIIEVEIVLERGNINE